MIQFLDGSNAKALIYSSGAEQALRIETVSEKTIIENTLELQGTTATVKTGCQLKYQGKDDLQVQLERLQTTATTIYVDSNRSDAYTESGSRDKPYKTLGSALTAKLQDASTQSFKFKLATGSYTA